MDTLILVLIFTSLAFGIYRLKKHSDQTRKEMMEELDLLEDLNSPNNLNWEDQEADVQPEQPKVPKPTPVVEQPKPKPKKLKGRPRKNKNGKV
jgi:hypothetical protein